MTPEVVVYQAIRPDGSVIHEWAIPAEVGYDWAPMWAGGRPVGAWGWACKVVRLSLVAPTRATTDSRYVENDPKCWLRKESACD
jgi:hypothetical protein